MQNLQLVDPFGGQGDFDVVTAVNEAQQRDAQRIADLEKEVLTLKEREAQWYNEYYELLGLFQMVQEGLVVKQKPKPTLKSVQMQVSTVLAIINDGLRSQPQIAA